MRQMKSSKDPAPSVLRYRLQRIWLTPSIRKFLKLLPLVLVVGSIALLVGGNPRVQAQMVQAVFDVRDAFVSRDEFRVTDMEISGASSDLRDEVKEVASVRLPTSSLDLDVGNLRSKIESLPGVSNAAVRVGSGGVLRIDLTERVPAVLWRSSEGLYVLDTEGVSLSEASSRLDFPDLPLVLGRGADQNVSEAIQLIGLTMPLNDRLRGVQRVGERRWTIVLDRGQTIWLPENSPVSALRRLMAIQKNENILEKDITVVDLRDSKKPVLRLGLFAQDEMWRQKTSDIWGGE